MPEPLVPLPQEQEMDQEVQNIRKPILQNQEAQRQALVKTLGSLPGYSTSSISSSGKIGDSVPQVGTPSKEETSSLNRPQRNNNPGNLKLPKAGLSAAIARYGDR